MSTKLELDERNRLVAEARELWVRRDLRAMAALLDGLTEEDLFEEPELGYRRVLLLVDTQRFDEALTLNLRLQEQVHRQGNARLVRDLVNVEGIQYFYQGMLDQAEARFREALAHDSEAAQGMMVAMGTNLGVIASIRCDWDESIVAHSRSLIAAQRAGKLNAIANCHHNLAMAYRPMGLFRAACAHFEYALQLHRSIGSYAAVNTEVERALLFHQMGDSPRAEAMIRRVLELVRSRERRRDEGEAMRVLGIILSARAPSEAEECFNRALGLAEQTKNRLLEAEVLEEMAALEADRGELEQARALAESSARIYRGMGAERHAEMAVARIG